MCRQLSTISLDGDMTGASCSLRRRELTRMSNDADLPRALLLIVPYWRRLVLAGVSRVGTALSPFLPLLSKEFFDNALLGRDVASLAHVARFFPTVTLTSFTPKVCCDVIPPPLRR